MSVIKFSPSIEQHPCYKSGIPDISVGDVVITLNYNGVRVIWDDDGNKLGVEWYGPDGTMNNYTVCDIAPFKVKLGFGVEKRNPEWYPKDIIVGIDAEKKKEYEKRRKKLRRRRKRIEERVNVDLDVLMSDIVIPHAERKVEEVWNNTIDIGKVEFFWNTRLRTSAGMAYYGSSVPDKIDARYAVGLAPGYYYKHGIDEFLEVVRHELIHIWQRLHEAGDGMGHGPKFRQWIDDMDTHRHCKHW